MDLLTVIVVLFIIAVVFGGWGYRTHPRTDTSPGWGYWPFGPIVGLVILVVILRILHLI